MAKNTGVKATLSIDTSEAQKALEELAKRLTDIKKQLEGKNTINLSVDQSTVAQTKQHLTNITKQTKASAKEISEADQKAIKSVQELITKSGTAIKETMEGGVKSFSQLRKLMREIEQYKANLGKNFTGLFPSDSEAYKQNKQHIVEMNRLIRQATSEAKNFTDQFVKAGRQIQSTGRTIKNLGQNITTFSNTGLSMIKSIATGALRTMTVMGFASHNLMSDAVDDIKTLEYAQVGLQNQFAKKEEGFDVTAYIEKIRETARTTMGVSAGDLADYLNQVAPVATDSQQAYDVTMGLLKAITYSGGDASTELGYVVRNIRDVLAKGKAYQMDINQFNRAIPGFTNILSEMGLSQFLDDSGQLEITKDNVDQLMNALAMFNSPNSPVYGILEQMNNSLGGLLEESKETIQQSVANAITNSGLLDVWKNLLRNDSIQRFISDLVNGVAGGIASFFSNIEVDEVLNTFFDTMRDIGKYLRDSIVPALKDMLGLEEGASLTELINSIIMHLGEFVKGLISGAKVVAWVVGRAREAFQWFSGILSRFGIQTEGLATALGFAITAGSAVGRILNLFGSSLIGVGKQVVNFGKNLYQIFKGGEATGVMGIAQKGANKIADLINMVTGGDTTGGKVLGGAGIAAVGHLASGPLSELSKVLTKDVFKWKSEAQNYVQSVAKNATDLSSTFLGVTLAAGPVAGAATTLVEALFKVGKAANSLHDTVMEGERKIKEASLSSYQNFVYNIAQESLRSSGLFQFEDDNSEDALSYAMDVAKNIRDTTDPFSAAQQIIDAYMDKYSKNLAADKFASYLAAITDQESSSYIEGLTAITTDFANSERGTEMLKTLYDTFFSLGMLPQGAATEDYTGQEYLNLFNRLNWNIGNQEQLQAMYDYVTNINKSIDETREKASNIELRFGDENLAEEFDDIMREMNFRKNSEGNWVLKSEIEMGISQAEDQLKNIIDSMNEKLKNSPINIPVVPKSALDASDSLKNPLWGTFSKGGKVTPIYRAGGGNTPSMGVDTVPAMLAPGEFVQKASAVKLAGLGVMEALNHGDLRMAYGLLGAKLNNYTTNSSKTNNINSTRQSNNFFINNFGASGRANTYNGIRNRMALR